MGSLRYRVPTANGGSNTRGSEDRLKNLTGLEELQLVLDGLTRL